MEETKRIAVLCLTWTWMVLCGLVVQVVVFLHEVWQAICRIASSLFHGSGVVILVIVVILLPLGALVFGLSYLAMLGAQKAYEAFQNWQKQRKAERKVLKDHLQEVNRVVAADTAR